MHALVTGGGGFLGRYIVEQLLARGDRVRSLGRGRYPELETLGVEVFRGDIADRDAVSKACQSVDAVFHVAALPGIAMQWAPYEQANIRGTAHVIAGCRAQGVSRLVYTSSPSVVFAGVDQCGVNESAPYDFAWMKANGAHYSHSKALAEQAVLAATDATLRTCALRPHLIWGPRDNHLIPRLIARARAGRLRRVGDGTNRVDTIYVENAAVAHLQAADALLDASSSVAGRAYFLSQNEPANCWEWIDEILELVKLPPVRKTISRRNAERAGALLENIYRLLSLSGEPPMTRFLAAQLATSHWFDLSASRRDFGYAPAFSTAEGMQRLGAWLRS
ncbi:NAD-dependent epimerase/dehydratase family protein [Lacipirellula limnantheis]|uniref:3 beta-hydroxysteroid dehydrogenase/Delta 5-->4-isomerase n=1 Tax=Lacipirellula limnantheis TaxID=2528024 RepID=A0A517TUG1_9BACT|nr:NAD-dependent epimerase/dehydratase family protein [Lacipirellula limnantheis]QDT72005.1 3 beta-hydroxysteroid dehydrogenase/Delta 5-->4-isomerase [Lacipirellula limnantheis]